MGPKKLIFFGSRGSLDESESGSIQPDFKLKVRDTVAQIKPLSIYCYRTPKLWTQTAPARGVFYPY